MSLIVEPAMGLDLENWGELEDDVFLDEVKGCNNIKTFITSPGHHGEYRASTPITSHRPLPAIHTVCSVVVLFTNDCII